MEITLKITKKRVLASVAALAAVGTLVGFMAPGLGGNSNRSSSSSSAASSTIKTVRLEKRDLASSISATGIIYSQATTNVYSSLSYTVAEIKASVGDKVKEGDVLAMLDTSSLEADIAQKEASAGSSYAKAQQSLTEAQRDLSNYQRDVKEGYDSSVKNAQTSIVSAEMDVKNAELDLESAQTDLYAARRELREARNGEGDYASEEASDSKLNSLKTAVTQKEYSVEKAESKLEKAKNDLENAKSGLTSAKVGSDDTLASYQSKVKSAQLSLDMNDQWLSIENLKKDLEKCTITAPVSGTITAVNAVQGAGASGVLFVIQNDSNLKIVTEIAEYDVGSVSVGDNVLITTEATGDTQFEGKLSRVAPTTTLTAAGSSATSTDAVFEAEITVSGSHDGLRIGMNAALSIVTDERKDVFAVPFEAVATERGQAYVFAAESQPDGTYLAKKVTVEQGIETDVYVEVSGDGLAEGMLIVKSATGITEGQTLDIPAAAGGGMTDEDMASRAAMLENMTDEERESMMARREAMGGEMPEGGMPEGGMPAGGMAGGMAGGPLGN